MNTPLVTLLDPPAFTPSPSARWINALFFNSLVLSLASAIFGILAKQWLREYMQWNSPLGAPRENVLVRQIRFEAWEAWNVGATIAAIPALIELAMILFLSGVVILLWTLDDVVAIAVTVVVAVFLGVVSAFTVMPVFFRRCPYKSPTAWACVAGYHLVTAPFIFCARFCRAYAHCVASRWDNEWIFGNMDHSFSGRLRAFLGQGLWPSHDDIGDVPWPSRPRNWRERDLDTCKIPQSDMPSSDVHEARLAAKLEIARETTHLDKDGAFLVEPYSLDVPDPTADALLADVSETSLLLRALSWVQQASHDTRIGDYIDSCIDTVHPDGSTDDVSTLANWCIVSSLKNNRLSSPRQVLLASANRFPSSKTTTTTDLRQVIGVRSLSPAFSETYKLYRKPPQAFHARELATRSHGHVLLRILAASLKKSGAALPTSTSRWASGDYLQLRRIFELIGFLSDLDTSCGFLGSDRYLDGLRPIFCNTAFKSLMDDSCIGLRSTAFQLASKHAKVSVGEEHNLGTKYSLNVSMDTDRRRPVVLSEGVTERFDFEQILLDYFATCAFDRCSRDELDIFVLSAIGWLKLASSPTSDGTTTSILLRMAEAAQAAQDLQGGREYCPRHGDDAAWVSAVHAWYMTIAPGQYGAPLRCLLHALERSYASQRLVGDHDSIRQYLHESLRMAHDDIDGCDAVEQCHWVAHTQVCEAWWLCTLLPDIAPRETTDSTLEHTKRKSTAATAYASVHRWLVDGCRRLIRFPRRGVELDEEAADGQVEEGLSDAGTTGGGDTESNLWFRHRGPSASSPLLDEPIDYAQPLSEEAEEPSILFSADFADSEEGSGLSFSRAADSPTDVAPTEHTSQPSAPREALPPLELSPLGLSPLDFRITGGLAYAEMDTTSHSAS